MNCEETNRDSEIRAGWMKMLSFCMGVAADDIKRLIEAGYLVFDDHGELMVGDECKAMFDKTRNKIPKINGEKWHPCRVKELAELVTNHRDLEIPVGNKLLLNMDAFARSIGVGIKIKALREQATHNFCSYPDFNLIYDL